MADDSSHKIVKTTTLKVQIFRMPVVDLSVRFAYLFVEPIPMIWQVDGRISHALTMQVDHKRMMADYLLRKYWEVIENSKRQGLWSPELEWLTEVDSVEIIECELMVTDGCTFKVESLNELKEKVNDGIY